MEHVLQCESGNADAVFKHIDVAVLVKLKHLVDGFQHGFDVFVVVPCQELFHGLHVVVFPHSGTAGSLRQRYFRFLKYCRRLRGGLADVQFVHRGHPLVREEPFLFCRLVGFQVLTISKARGKIIVGVQELQLLCLDAHEIVVPFHGILDLVTVHMELL